MESKFKVGMYVRVSVDYEDDKEPRMFAIGQIDNIDMFGNIEVIFNKDFRNKEEEIIYDYIPDSRVYPESKVQRCKILKRTTGLFGIFEKFTVLKFKDKDDEGYYRYYAECENNVKVISEKDMIVDFTRGEINPVIQMKNYEFQSPFWYGQRLLPGEILNILNNLDKNFKTLISSRAYLFQHQIDTIVRALKEDKIRLMFADEVGLGKTIEALVVLKGKGLNKALIIVPDSLVNQWKNEIYVKLWMDSYVYQGGELPKKGIVLVPFEILDNLNIEKIIDKYDFCIIDEVHRCLSNTKLFTDLHRICKGIDEVILLSATPIQDRKEEYLKLLKLLKPEIYDSMKEEEFIDRYKKSMSIRKTVFSIISDLEDLDEDIAEEIEEDLSDICKELEDKGLKRIISEIDIESENYGEEKIREALAYISENYQFERSIIRHRREEIQSEMPKRVLKSITYEMKGGDESFYELNTYEKVFEYVEYLLNKSPKNDQIAKYVIKIINSMFSSPWALENILNIRNKFINSNRVIARNSIEKSLIEIIKDMPEIKLEEKYILQIYEQLKRWKNATQIEIDNIVDRINDASDLKGRFGLIADYIDQELYDKKIIIFTAYPETLTKLKSILKNLFGSQAVVTFSVIDDRGKKEENVEKFQNDNECKIMICDESGGEGRNFQLADSIIHFDIPFSPTILEQRIGRLDRLGREKSKDVENIVIVTEDTLETDLFNLWNDGLNIFTESLSGLEIALDNINKYIIDAMITDLKFGLNDILEEIKRNLKEIRAVVKEERYYDMSRQLDSKTKERYESIINKFDSEGGEILASAMIKWCRAVGFSPSLVEDEEGKILNFSEDSISYKAMSNTMFDIPNTVEALKRRAVPGIRGTFDRTVAVNRENLSFFAPGEDIFDSIMKNVEEGYRGRCSAVQAYNSDISWEGFIFRFNTEFDIKYLIEDNISLSYEVFSNGHMPLNQIKIFIPLNGNEQLNKDKKDYILEFISSNYNKKSSFIHLGERGKPFLQKFKTLYKKYQWNEIITNAYESAKKEVVQEYNYLINRKELIKELSMILAGARASTKYLNNKEIDCNEFKRALEKVRDGVLRPDISLDSILYINLKKDWKND